MPNLYKCLFFSLILSSSTCIFGQEKKPIEFQDYELEWLHEVWIDSLSVYDQVYTLVREPIFVDEFIIAIYTINQSAPSGFLIQKANLNTGNVIWSYGEFTEEQYSRRFVQDFKLINDTLELYLLEESETIYNLVYPWWDSCHLALLKLDINNGQVLESIRTDHSDPQNIILEKAWVIGSVQVVSGIENGYRVVKTEEQERNDTTRLENFISIDVDYNGHILNSDTITLTFPWFNQELAQNYPLNSDAFISHVSTRLLPPHDPEYFSSLLILDKNLQSYDSIQLHNYFKHESLRNMIVVFNDEEKFLIETSNSFSEEEYEQNFFLFDYEGNLLFKYENSIDLSAHGEVFWPVAYDEDNNLIGIGEYQDFETDTLTHLYFWKTSSSIEIDTLLDIAIKDKDINVYPLIAFITNDNDLIAFYDYQQPSYPYEIAPGFPPHWYFWIKIKGEDLGLKTSSIVEAKSESLIKIFPNPVSDMLYIESDNVFTGELHLVNSDGRFIEKIDLDGIERTKELNLANLSSGIYFLNMINKQGIILESKKIVKH